LAVVLWFFNSILWSNKQPSSLPSMATDIAMEVVPQSKPAADPMGALTRLRATLTPMPFKTMDLAVKLTYVECVLVEARAVLDAPMPKRAISSWMQSTTTVHACIRQLDIPAIAPPRSKMTLHWVPTHRLSWMWRLSGHSRRWILPWCGPTTTTMVRGQEIFSSKLAPPMAPA
jgi:hypothetical protein